MGSFDILWTFELAEANADLEKCIASPRGFYGGPGADWMPSDFYADNANTLEVAPYALLNFKIGHQGDGGWSGHIEGRNLLDKRYISSTITAETANAASALFSPGYGRAVYAGIRFTW